MKIKTFNDKNLKAETSSYIISLNRLDLLKPGSVVNGTTVENILGVKYSQENWDFIGKYIVLKSQLESLGYFITQSDLDPPAFRILKTEEMADHAAKRFMKTMSMNYKTALVMSNHDTSSLEDREKKKFNSVKQKAAAIALYQQKLIMDDFMFE